jgi:hypothetical protein
MPRRASPASPRVGPHTALSTTSLLAKTPRATRSINRDDESDQRAADRSPRASRAPRRLMPVGTTAFRAKEHSPGAPPLGTSSSSKQASRARERKRSLVVRRKRLRHPSGDARSSREGAATFRARRVGAECSVSAMGHIAAVLHHGVGGCAALSPVEPLSSVCTRRRAGRLAVGDAEGPARSPWLAPWCARGDLRSPGGRRAERRSLPPPGRVRRVRRSGLPIGASREIRSVGGPHADRRPPGGL